MAKNVKVEILAQDKTARAFKSARERAKGLTSVFKTLAKVGVGAAVGLGAAFVKVQKDLDKLGKSAKDAQIGVETFQKWQFAASQSGVSAEEFAASLGRAQKRIGEFAARGTGAAAKSLEKLGVSLRTVDGDMRDQESILRDYFRALDSLGSAQERTSAITDLFGANARKMTLAFGQGTEVIEDFERQAESLGLVISGNTIAAAEKFNDQLDILQRVLQGKIAENMGKIAPSIIAVTEAAIELIPVIADATSSLLQLFGIGKKAELLDSLGDLNSELFFVDQKIKNLTPMKGGFLDFFGGSATESLAELERNKKQILSRRDTIFSEISAIDKPVFQPRFTNSSTETFNDQPSLALLPSTTQAEKNDFYKIQTEMFNFQSNLFFAKLEQTQELKDAQNKAAKEQLKLNQKIYEDSKASFQDLFQDNMVMAAETGFKSVLDSWARTLQQMMFKALSSGIFDLLAGIGGGGFGSFGGLFKSVFGGFKADGGSVSRGKSYIVGERGPELFAPNQSGSIIPNAQDSGGINIVNNIDASGGGADVDQRIRVAVTAAGQQTVASVQDLLRRRRLV
jgi:hypothetical protein